MKIKYRGYEINIDREACLGGWSQLYVSIYRVRDGLEVESFNTEDESTVEVYMDHMKRRVDNELASSDPWGLKAGRVA